LKKTAFYNAHLRNKAKMVEFGGFLMPIQYTSIITEHKTVRNKVGVFDVSHMGEIFIRGDKALDFVQRLTINDASKLKPGRVQYSAMCYESGGVVDDLLVYMISPTEYLLVVNASNLNKDYEWMVKNNKEGVELSNESDEYSLLAVQGPRSKAVLEKLFGIQLETEYYHFINHDYNGNNFIISRTGYTGELGFEIYFKATEEEAIEFWDKLFEAGKEEGIEPIGLGARDSLRLEMGYSLYGNDISQDTNPLEAGLGWITKLNKANDFIGKNALLEVKKNGLKRKLVPLVIEEKAFPRHGYVISYNGESVGEVTSGTVSPILDKGVALAYVRVDLAELGNTLNMVIRGKEIPCKVVTLPFIHK